MTGLPFVKPCARCRRRPIEWAIPRRTPAASARHTVRESTTRQDRAYEVNQLPWEHFTTPPATEHAQAFLRHPRGIDLTALRRENGGHRRCSPCTTARRSSPLDGDTAGEQGTRQWLRLLCMTHDRPALVTSLPNRSDPADWLQRHGDTGLAAFAPAARPASLPDNVAQHQPGRELVRACLDSSGLKPLTSGVVPLVLAARANAWSRLSESNR